MALNFLVPLLLPVVCCGMRSFTFRESNSLSFASLANGPRLPPEFTVCLSHLQPRVANRGTFQLLGADGAPWLSIQFYQENKKDKQFKLWGFFGAQSAEELLGNGGPVKLGRWQWVCLKVDTNAGTVSAKVDDGELTRTREVALLKTNMPTNLTGRLKLGVSTANDETEQSTQFHGSITNVQFWKGSQDWPKCSDYGDLLAWDNSNWKKEGGGVQEAEVEEVDVCNPPTTQLLPMPYAMTQKEALRTCDMLGRSHIPIQRNNDEFTSYIQWFQATAGEMCKYSWTQLVYRKGKGVTPVGNDNVNVTFLPGAGSPSQELGQQAVSIFITEERMIFESSEEKNCFSCAVDLSVNLVMRGLACESSFLGEHI